MIERNQDGTVSFRVYRPQAMRVDLVASFTRWDEQPIPLRKNSDGWWSLTLNLPIGDHEFQYLIDNSEWLGDFAADGVRLNDYSQWLGLLHIQPVAAKPHMVVRRAGIQQSTPARTVA